MKKLPLHPDPNYTPIVEFLQTMDELNLITDSITSTSLGNSSFSMNEQSQINADEVKALEDCLKRILEFLSQPGYETQTKSYFIENDGLYVLYRLFGTVSSEDVTITKSLMMIINSLAEDKRQVEGYSKQDLPNYQERIWLAGFLQYFYAVSG